MSRMATNEYIGAKRRMYTTADRKKRIRILDEVCETTGYERKYANRLLTGSRKFRERKGRGKTWYSIRHPPVGNSGGGPPSPHKPELSTGGV